MGALKYLPVRRAFWARAITQEVPDQPRRGSSGGTPAFARDPEHWDFLTAREALVASGVPVVEARVAQSEADAVAQLRHFGTAVAVKAEAPGLLHKSDLGCVRLRCVSEHDVSEAYRAVAHNARKAGFESVKVLIQPMIEGVAEAYAGIIDDPRFGPAICFGLGGVFVEILRDTVTEMAPLSRDDALRMIRGVKGAPLFDGARGRGRADIGALAELLVNLGGFAVANRGRFRALDLNPIMVGTSGAVAVDIAIEPIETASAAANAAE
jgi:acyl-CoA synthetase (NDP forming)